MMMTIVMRVVMPALLALAALPAAGPAVVLAADVYVAPTGSDDGSGARERPLRTPAAARRAVRAARGRGRGAVTVHLAAGTYYLDEPLVLTADDSGENDTPVVWQADGEGEVVLSGGVRLDHLAWKPYKGGILRADVPAGTRVDQLFVNGERQVLARYPDYDPGVAIFNGYAADAISPERVARWADPAGGFLHAMHPSMWGGFSYRILGKDEQGHLNLEGGWQGNRPGKPHPKYRYVENVFEELDAPGEWFLDGKAHALFFYPPAGTDLSTAVVEGARLPGIVEFRGTARAPVKWVSFRGMTFRHTARTFMETREPLLRSDWTIYRGGAVLFAGAEDCSLEGASLDQVGGNAVFVSGYNRRVTVRGCRIEQAGASGVLFVGQTSAARSPVSFSDPEVPPARMDRTPGPKTDDYPADCLVEQCLIDRTGRVEKQSAGVGIDIAARVTVRHCSIYDVPRAGINIGDGCFGGHVIEFCDVFDTVRETGDHGAFNSWGRDRFWVGGGSAQIDAVVAANPDLPLLDVVEPITLRNSRWRCDHGWDIDLDDGSSYYHIYDNLCLAGGIKNREGYRRIVENNVMAYNTFHPHVWLDNSGDVFRHNIIFRPYRPIKMPRAWGERIDGNLLHDPSVHDPRPAVALQRLSHQDAHSLVGDAHFADPGRGDYTVAEGSPALAVGFHNFPMDQFGVTEPRLKALARTPSFAAPKEAPSRRGSAVQTWMGAKVRNIVGMGEMSAHGLPGETGVLVLEVPADSPLAKAGLKADDVILGMNGKSVGQVADLTRPASQAGGSGTPLTLTVSREQGEVSLTVPGGP